MGLRYLIQTKMATWERVAFSYMSGVPGINAIRSRTQQGHTLFLLFGMTGFESATSCFPSSWIQIASIKNARPLS